MRLLTGVIALLLLVQTGCVKSEQENLLKAVQDFPIQGIRTEKVIHARETMIQGKGFKVSTQWQVKKVDENNYQVVALQTTSAGKSWDAEYVWKLEKKPSKNPTAKGSSWKMKAENRRAKSLMQLPLATISDWMSSGKTAQVQHSSL